MNHSVGLTQHRVWVKFPNCPVYLSGEDHPGGVSFPRRHSPQARCNGKSDLKTTYLGL